MESELALERRPLVPNAVLGVSLFVCAELMLFAGLVSALLVLRAGAGAWPPPGQPRLPVGVTGANTLVLLASGVAMVRAARGGRGLGLAAALGAVFLAVQGAEWVRLVGFGLTGASSLYASTFYLLVGVHGAHVLGGLAFLLVLLVRGSEQARRGGWLTAAAIYWSFVVLVWPVLYVLVYLR